MMKRILFLSPNLGGGGGGSERQIVTVACLLKNRGYDVEFLCYSEGNFYFHILELQHIPVYWMISSNYLKRMISVRKFIRSGKYDVVISFLNTPNFLNNFATVGGKRWKVITGERSAKEENFLSRQEKVFAWFQRFADYIVCNSENAKNMWIKYYPQYAGKMVVIYNNVNLPSITSTYIPKRYGKLHIVVAASYQYLKNPIGLIKAIASMSEEEREKIVVDWYGKNDDLRREVYDEANRMIGTLGVKNIILHPVVSDILNIINTSDAVALLSSVEGLPNAICEGMMLGKLVIMSRISDYEILVDDTNGFLCDWDDIASIKNAILSAANLSVEQLEKMGKSSRNKAERLFSTTIVNKWISLIEK